MATSPVFNAEPHEGRLCPKCGRLFEVPFTVGPVHLDGHPVGHPKLCVPIETMFAPRDARVRRQGRRGT